MTDAPSSNEFLRALDRTERYVLALHYADELTASEIGVVLDLPEYRVQNILRDLRRRAGKLLGLRSSAA